MEALKEALRNFKELRHLLRKKLWTVAAAPGYDMILGDAWNPRSY